MPLTKAELRQQVEELTARLHEAKEQLRVQTREHEQQLAQAEADKEEAVEQVAETDSRMTEVQDELRAAREFSSAQEAEKEQMAVELAEVSRKYDTGVGLSDELEEARDEIDRQEWQLQESQKEVELAVARAWSEAREVHKRELEAREDLIALLKEKISALEAGRKADLTANLGERSSSLGSGSPQASRDSPSDASDTEPAPASIERRRSRRRLSLPPLLLFSGEVADDEGAFNRWLRKLERHAELEQWSPPEKLAQLELHLTGKSERLFELLPDECRQSYEAAVEGLKKRLTPVRREALLSAQLIKRKQQAQESVDSYAQNFETLFERSYGSRLGMDPDSREILKRDLFVQGLCLKWQEKVLPSAESFADALYQARVAEEQEKQLSEMHKSTSSAVRLFSKRPDVTTYTSNAGPPSKTRTLNRSSEGKETTPPARPEKRTIACYHCGSTRHKVRECPQRKPPPESTGRRDNEVRCVSGTANSSCRCTVEKEGSGAAQELESRCQKLRQEWTEAEFRRMSAAYDQTADVDTVSGPVGPLYFAQVEVAGVPVEAMVDPGSAATILSFELFQSIGKRAGIPRDALKPPGVLLRDYSQHPIPVGACVDLTIAWKGQSVTTPVYLRSDLGVRGEPCLLGTNVVIPLGLMVPGPGVQPRGTPSQSASKGFHTEGVVRLVQAQRIPGRCARFVEAEVDGRYQQVSTVVFEPDPKFTETVGLHLEESVVSREQNGLIQVLIQNPTSEAVQLAKSITVGRVEAGYDTESGTVSENPECESRLEKQENLTEIGVNWVEEEQHLPTQEGDAARKAELATMVTVNPQGLTESEQQLVSQCVMDANDIFALSDSERGEVSIVEHHIDTGQSPPVKQAPRRVPFALRPTITRLVQDMLKHGVVQESDSPWASPVVLVKKKDGSMRFCVDYRRLNALTRKDVFPMPRIDDLLDQLAGKKVFSTLDARTGYWQIRMGASSQEKTAFVTVDGLYEFKVMPFGLTNSPATFQRLMQRTLRGLGGEEPFCSVYIDDIVIFSRTAAEHVQHLKQVFDRLRKVGLKLHPKKCQFAAPAVLYLGHVVSARGISPNPDKVRAVKEFEPPTSVKGVRQFLGLAGYYRRFIPNFAKLAGPLHSLTRQDILFQWTPSCQVAFDNLKELLVTSPVLAYPDFNHPFTLHTDASGAGLGAVLEQEDGKGQLHPVAYASRTLSKHERNYGVTEMEALGVVWSLRHFRAYLWGHHTTLYTDHAPLTAMLRTRHSSGKLARWSETIAEYDLEIRYKTGKRNQNADALSRSPVASPEEEMHLVAEVTNVPNDPSSSELGDLQRIDPDLKHLFRYVEKAELPDNEKLAKRVVLMSPQFVVVDGILYYIDAKLQNRRRIAVPTASREQLMHEAHAGGASGHFAAKSQYTILSRLYWWEGMYSDVLKHCQSCLTCATYRGTGRRYKAPLQPLPVGDPFDRVGVDILEMPLTTTGNRYVIVFAEYLTKWIEAYATPDQTSETIARLLVDCIVCRHGVPNQLLSDRGPNLLSTLIYNVCELLGMRKINTTAYHPQGDGLVENFNRTLQGMIAKHAKTFGPEWDLYLQHLLFAYRSKPHASTGESPFYLLYGRDPRVPTETALTKPRTPYQVDLDDYRIELTHGLTEAWRLAKKNIGVAQRKQKVQYDKQAKARAYHPGDRVMVYMPHEHSGKKRKMALPYHGPYRILEVLPNGLSVRPVDRPQEQSILVNKDRVTVCHPDLPDVSWLGNRKRRPRRRPNAPAIRQEAKTKSPPIKRQYNLRSRSSPEDV